MLAHRREHEARGARAPAHARGGAGSAPTRAASPPRSRSPATRRALIDQLLIPARERDDEGASAETRRRHGARDGRRGRHDRPRAPGRDRFARRSRPAARSTTAVAVSRTHPEPDAARAIGECLAAGGARRRVPGRPRGDAPARRARPAALAWPTPSAAARATLSDPAVLADVCRASSTTPTPRSPARSSHAAGPAGAEALLDAYIRAGEAQRSLLRPALRGDGRLGHRRRALASCAPTTRSPRSRSCARSPRSATAAPCRSCRKALDQPQRVGALRRDHRARRYDRARGGDRAHQGARPPGARDAALRRARDRAGQGRPGGAPAHARARGPQPGALARDARRRSSTPWSRSARPRRSAHCAEPPTASSCMGRKSRELRSQARSRAREHRPGIRTPKELTRSDRHAVPPRERRPARHTGRARDRDDRVRRGRGAVRHAREARARPRPRAHARGRAHERVALPDVAPARSLSRSPTSSASLRALAEFGFDEVTINIYKGTLFVENQVFPEESVTYRKLVEELLARGISAVTFTSMTTADETAVLVELIAEHGDHRHRGGARVPRGARRHVDHRRRDDDARGHGQRGAQPRGARPGARELRRRRRRDARRRDAGQARPGVRGRAAAARGRVDARQPAPGPGRRPRPDRDQGPRRLHAQPLDQRVHPLALARLGARPRRGGAALARPRRRCSTTSARSASPRTS